jgi:glucose-6-phosphate 1-epimerase
MAQEFRVGDTITQQQLNDAVSVLDVDNLHARARISLFGGQVLSFCPHLDGRERLFQSSKARLDGSKSIRGGIPVCWPWFGAHKLDSAQPAHGYIRTRPWQLKDKLESVEGTVLVLAPEQCAGPGFSGEAELELHISVGRQLRLELCTRNLGKQPMALSCALHSYFAAQHIQQVELQGLAGQYSDKTRDWAHFETPEPYTFSEETDRIHLQACRRVVIKEGTLETTVESVGHDSIVVWNPWQGCEENFTDMAADDYSRMLCVETALTQGFELAPGRLHMLTQVVY